MSVGEVLSALPLIGKLREEQPLTAVYLSTSTIAGRRAAEREAESLTAGLFYCPLDYVSCIRRTLKALRPALLIVLETEIWPNLYAETKRTGAALAIVNGRISDRAWPRYRMLKTFFSPVLSLPDVIFVQSAIDRDRFIQLGAPALKAQLEANLKYDASRTNGGGGALETFGAEHVWIAASTAGPNERGSVKRHSVDEDEIVLAAFQALTAEFPRLLLILAPRQPARFNAVARKLEIRRIPFVRRTDTKASASNLQLPGVLLLDTIGELPGIYSCADVVFVGGSIAPRGGHNITEPAAAEVAIVVGPHMENFAAITRDFLDSNAIVQIEREEELLPVIRELLLDRGHARELGQRAGAVMNRQRGVATRIARSLQPLYHSAFFKAPQGLLARAMLGPLAFVWREGGAIIRRRSEHYAHSVSPLPVPVVSIGGITVGGSGKTPFTIYLGKRLSGFGFAPAILTRGYRRRSPAQNVIFAPGAVAATALTGDEAQIFLRSGATPIGIGANRYETAKILLAQFPKTGVLLLDDGFQHARLKRDLDIVLIDGLDPFGQEALVPLGRLREPLSALDRAQILVVTRAQDNLRYEAICARLREYNAHAPIFRTRLLARHWRDYRTGACVPELAAHRVAAFCGLGNPENFWRTLESLGLEIVFRWAFDDHHSYKPIELQALAQQARECGAEILVTTEKDRINCPNHLEKAIAPLDLAWLEIDIEIEDETTFFALIERTLGRHVMTRHRTV